MQYITKRISWKTWFKPERNWKLFANSDFLKSYTPGWLRRGIHIRLTVIYKLNGFGFTWLKRKSYWKTHFTESLVSSCGLLGWSAALDISLWIFHFLCLHCLERESTFKDAAKSPIFNKFIALAMRQRCDYFKKTFWFSLMRISP